MKAKNFSGIVGENWEERVQKKQIWRKWKQQMLADFVSSFAVEGNKLVGNWRTGWSRKVGLFFVFEMEEITRVYVLM